MMYKVSFENGFITEVEADDMRAVEVEMYDKYGVDAIGMNITGDPKNFRFAVCRESWERVLAEYFPNFTLEDVVNHLKVSAYAWLHFDTVKYYDWYDGEECEVTSLCDEGLDYIHNNDALSVEMDRIDFRW